MCRLLNEGFFAFLLCLFLTLSGGIADYFPSKYSIQSNKEMSGYLYLPLCWYRQRAIDAVVFLESDKHIGHLSVRILEE